jgi:hypothetical protein
MSTTNLIKEETNRELLINAIIDFAGDEYENVGDYVKLAIKEEKDLIRELIDIARYFRNRDND